jgi:hypothetical protein
MPCHSFRRKRERSRFNGSVTIKRRREGVRERFLGMIVFWSR